MTRTTRRVLPLLAGMLAVLSIASPLSAQVAATSSRAHSSAQTYILNVWGGGGQTLTALKLVDTQFAKAYPNIQIKYTTKSNTNQAIQLAAAAGSGFPDVAIIADHYVKRYAQLGILADISHQAAPYIAAAGSYKFTLAAANGRYYAFPWDTVPDAVFYRRDVFAKAGVNPDSIQTWDDYFRAGQTIKAKAGVPLIDLATARNEGRFFELLLQQQGTGYIDASGKVAVDKDPRILAALEFMGRLWKSGLATNLEFFSNAWIQALANGGVATHPEEVWFGGTLKTYIAPKAGGKWGVFKLPAWKPGGPRAAGMGGSYLAIMQASAQKEAAWAYIQYHLARVDSQITMYKATDIFPTLQTSFKDPYFAVADPYFAGQKVREIFASVAQEIPGGGAAAIFSPYFQQMRDLTVAQIQKYALGQVSAKGALATAGHDIRAKTHLP